MTSISEESLLKYFKLDYHMRHRLKPFDRQLRPNVNKSKIRILGCKFWNLIFVPRTYSKDLVLVSVSHIGLEGGLIHYQQNQARQNFVTGRALTSWQNLKMLAFAYLDH